MHVLYFVVPRIVRAVSTEAEVRTTSVWSSGNRENPPGRGRRQGVQSQLYQY